MRVVVVGNSLWGSEWSARVQSLRGPHCIVLLHLPSFSSSHLAFPFTSCPHLFLSNTISISFSSFFLCPFSSSPHTVSCSLFSFISSLFLPLAPFIPLSTLRSLSSHLTYASFTFNVLFHIFLPFLSPNLLSSVKLPVLLAFFTSESIAL